MGLWRILEARFSTTESPWEHPTIGLGIQNFVNFFKLKFPEKKTEKKKRLISETEKIWAFLLRGKIWDTWVYADNKVVSSSS